jgi:hypothetical protein
MEARHCNSQKKSACAENLDCPSIVENVGHYTAFRAESELVSTFADAHHSICERGRGVHLNEVTRNSLNLYNLITACPFFGWDSIRPVHVATQVNAAVRCGALSATINTKRGLQLW